MIRHPKWLQALLENQKITDICINGYETVFCDLGEGLREADPGGEGFRNAAELRDWALGVLAAAGKTWDARHPFADATLPSGHRVHLVFPPLAKDRDGSEVLLVSIRSRAHSAAPSSESERDACLDQRRRRWAPEAFEPLSTAVANGESVLIAGATGSGKTTLAADLLSFAPPEERIIALEDVQELQPTHPHFMTLLSRASNADGFGRVTLRDLLRQSLRMRPDRIVLGECRGEEVFELLQVLNTGHRGAVATVHANSARDALRRVELLCQLSAARELPAGAVRELISNGFQWIAHVTRTAGRRLIGEVQRVEGREGDTILLRPMLREGACQSRSTPFASTSSSWPSSPPGTRPPG